MLSNLYLPAWFNVLILLNGIDTTQNYYQKILRKTKIASSHIRCIITHLKKRELVEEKIKGKIKYLHLTESGRKMASHIIEVRKILKNETKQCS